MYIHTQMCYYRFMHTYTTSATRVPIEPLASERMSIPAMAHGSQGHRSCLCGVWRCVLTQVVWQFDSDFWADGLKLRSSCLHKQAVKCWSPSGQCYAECKRLDVHANVSPKICWEDAGLKWTYGRLLSRLLSNQCPLVCVYVFTASFLPNHLAEFWFKSVQRWQHPVLWLQTKSSRGWSSKKQVYVFCLHAADCDFQKSRLFQPKTEKELSLTSHHCMFQVLVAHRSLTSHIPRSRAPGARRLRGIPLFS